MFVSDCVVRELPNVLVNLRLVIDVELVVEVIELLIAQGLNAHCKFHNDLFLLNIREIAHVVFLSPGAQRQLEALVRRCQ